MKFIDLFAGLGGFHLALDKLGHTCVFACDIEEDLRKTYAQNFGLMPAGDIRQVDVRNIPQHDILCAGFPCQPFSKAGFQLGLKDKERGGLFYDILRIIQHHYPTFLIMENVPNIKNHNNNKTWKKITSLLAKEGYDVCTKDFSPHHFGIPQIRNRTYIVARKGKLNGFKWPLPKPDVHVTSVLSILDKKPEYARQLPQKVKDCLNIWQEFLDMFPENEKIPHPLWAMEFGATYPYEKDTPHKISLKELSKNKGSFGLALSGKRRNEIYKNLPSHAIRPNKKFPDWKIGMIKRNREFYAKHKNQLDTWLPKIMQFPSSFQKLEWNVGEGDRKIHKYIIQCRASGIKVKRLTTTPSLVAMNNTQVPIIPWENRYMTPLECSRLQSMEKLKLPESNSSSYRALGNAVNVQVVKKIAKSLLINEATHD